MLINQLYNLFNPWRPTNNYTHIYMGIYTHTHTNTHSLIIRQRWEVKRGGEGHSPFLGWEESIKFSLSPQTPSCSWLPWMLWNTIIVHQMNLPRSYVDLPKVTAAIPTTQGSSSAVAVGSAQDRCRARRRWPPPSPAPLISLARSRAGGWKLLKRTNTSQEILTLNICRLASASSAV